MTPVPILLYHSVGVAAAEAYRPWTVAPSQLDEHLATIDELGFTTLSVSQYLDRRSLGTLPERPCVVTFDDGLADFSEHAMPVLLGRDASATVYVVSGHVGGSSRWLQVEADGGLPMMTWRDLHDVHDAGIEIGAHSESHRELDVTRAASLDREIRGSRHRLSDGLGTPVRSFAYPHGYHSRRVVEAVRAAGFDSAAAVKDRWSHLGDDRFALARLFVWETTTSEDLHALLSDPAPPVVQDDARTRTLRGGWRTARWIRSRAAVRSR